MRIFPFIAYIFFFDEYINRMNSGFKTRNLVFMIIPVVLSIPFLLDVTAAGCKGNIERIDDEIDFVNEEGEIDMVIKVPVSL